MIILKTTGKSSTKPARAMLALVLALAIVAIPARALAGPATDEYRLRLPDAKGKKNSTEPAPNAGALPADISRQLAHDPNGKALAALASPQLQNADTGGDSSLLGALLGGLGDPLVLAVALSLLAIGGGARELSRRT